MADSTIKKIDSTYSPRGPMGQVYLAAGKRISMRLWREESGTVTAPTTREYETVGFVIEGSAELDSEGQRVRLDAGDSWVVPRGASHQYRIVDRFVAVEATSPPAEIHGRDEPAADTRAR